jgi:hypothetical protein
MEAVKLLVQGGTFDRVMRVRTSAGDALAFVPVHSNAMGTDA